MNDKNIYKRIAMIFIAIYISITSVVSAALLISRQSTAENQIRGRMSIADLAIQQQSLADSSKSIEENIRQNFRVETLNSMLSYCGIEAAVFDKNYDLIISTTGDWSALHENEDGTMKTVFISPADYLEKEYIDKAADKVLFTTSSSDIGDISQYKLKISGYLNDNRIIPKAIYSEKYIIKKSSSSSISLRAEPDETFPLKNNSQIYDGTETVTETVNDIGIVSLPYSGYSGLRCDKNQTEIRQFVCDAERLKRIVSARAESGSGINEQEKEYVQEKEYNYTLSSFQNGEGESFHIAFAYKYNVLRDSIFLLIILWSFSFVVFFTAAAILISGVRSNSKRRNELEEKRRYVTYALAHDLKAPLAVISGCAQNIHENIMPEKHKKYIETIARQSDKMSDIITEMLDMAKTDQTKLSLTCLSLRDAALEVLSEYEVRAQQKNIRFEISGNTDIRADREMIIKVIDNFIINAINHVNDGGEIKINISDSRFEVFNSGSSVPDEMLSKIWEAYTKADNARGSGGTGLGLYIAASILDKHGFDYGAANTEYGFSVWFTMT